MVICLKTGGWKQFVRHLVLNGSDNLLMSGECEAEAGFVMADSLQTICVQVERVQCFVCDFVT